jgi:hypothetical protein
MATFVLYINVAANTSGIPGALASAGAAVSSDSVTQSSTDLMLKTPPSLSILDDQLQKLGLFSMLLFFFIVFGLSVMCLFFHNMISCCHPYVVYSIFCVMT